MIVLCQEPIILRAAVQLLKNAKVLHDICCVDLHFANSP